jgi:hypothetical protein
VKPNQPDPVRHRGHRDTTTADRREHVGGLIQRRIGTQHERTNDVHLGLDHNRGYGKYLRII